MTDWKSNLILKAALLMVLTAFLLFLSVISCARGWAVANLTVALTLWLAGFVFGMIAELLHLYRRMRWKCEK